MRRAVACLLLIALPGPALAAIRPVQAEIAVTDIGDARRASLNLNVLEGRRTLYRLACGREGAAMMNCRLTDKGGRNLLDSRAQFLPGHILGACADDPVWGRTRHFKAGDMMVILSFSDIIQTRRELVPDGYHFRVTIRPWAATDREDDGSRPGCPRDLPV